MARSQSDNDFAGTIVAIGIIAAIVVTVVAIWFLVRAMNTTSNAFALRPRSRLLWGLVLAAMVTAALAAATQAPALWAAAAVMAGVLVVCARAVVESSQPLMRDPAGHEFLEEVKHEWWPAAPGRGWAELE